MPEQNIKLFLEINNKSLIFLVILEKNKIASIIQKEIIELKCVENGKLIITDETKKRLTTCNFLTPDVHNIINSLSLICLTIKRNKAIKKDNGTNLVKTPKKFNTV